MKEGLSDGENNETQQDKETLKERIRDEENEAQEKKEQLKER